MSTRPRESRERQRGAIAPPRLGDAMARAYRVSAEQNAHAQRHVAVILDSLAARLDAQRALGSPYLVGHQVSACDIHWACFSALLEPLPHAVNPMPDWLRAAYSYLGDEVAKHKHSILLAHRDWMFERHLALPLDF